MLKRRQPRFRLSRMAGFIGLGFGLTRAQRRGSPFDELFKNGEPGAVFVAQKPSDLLARRNQLRATVGVITAGSGTGDWTASNTSGVLQGDGSTLVTRTSTVAGCYSQNNSGGSGALARKPVAGQYFAAQLKVKQGTGPKFGLRFSGTYPERVDLLLDFASGSITAQGNVYTVTDSLVTLQADGYYVLTVCGQVRNTEGTSIIFGPTGAAGNASGWEGATGGLESAYVKEPHVEVSLSPIPAASVQYQKVTDWTTEYLTAVGDRVTQYTDNAGTTPVTALEQTVGLHLDTRPIFLGPNAITGTWTTQGDVVLSATSTTGFTASAGTGANTRGITDIPNAGGKTFRCSFTSSQAAILYARNGTAGSGPILANTGAVTSGSLDVIVPVGGNLTLLFDRTPATPYTVSQVNCREVISAPNTVVQPLRGRDQVTNGSFSVDANWTKGVDWTISGGVATKVAGAGTNNLSQDNPNDYITGAWYEVEFDITVTAGTFTLFLRGNNVLTITASGRKRVIAQAGSSTFTGVNFSGGATAAGSVDNVTAKLVYGNHRSQSSAPARPKLSARYNKVTAPNANPIATTGFALGGPGAATASITVVNDAAAIASAPAELQRLCTLGNVYKLDNSASASSTFVGVPGAAGRATSHTWAAYVRTTAGSGSAALSVTNNGAVPLNNISTYTKVSGTGVADAGSSAGFYINAAAGQTIWFILPDLRESCYSYLPTPQVVWDGTTGYDDTGFPARLICSGAQGMATGAIDLSGGDEGQIFGVLTKLSDAASGWMVCAGDTTSTGAFGLLSLSAGTVRGVSNGSVIASTSSPSWAAPSASVLSLAARISTDTNVLRINGAVAMSNAADQGSGNYGSSATLRYGSLDGAGTSSPWTGDEFISIVRGGATPSTAIIAAVERECAVRALLTI